MAHLAGWLACVYESLYININTKCVRTVWHKLCPSFKLSNTADTVKGNGMKWLKSNNQNRTMPFAHFLYTRWHIIIINTPSLPFHRIYIHIVMLPHEKKSKDCRIWIIYQKSLLIIVNHIWQMVTKSKTFYIIYQSLWVSCLHPILTKNNWKRLKIVTGQSQMDKRLAFVSQNIFTWGCFFGALKFLIFLYILVFFPAFFLIFHGFWLI